jgi:hypothetical protein
MTRFLLQLLALALLSAAGICAERPKALILEKANVLPLALDDAFGFKKTKILFNDPRIQKQTTTPMIAFERQRVNFGAVTQYDRQQRYGQYYTFFWRANRPTDLTVRFEYRQERLGAYVQAQERHYKNAKGTYISDFSVIGDDYNEDGRVTSWRAILIENGKIVALNQSFLWR